MAGVALRAVMPCAERVAERTLALGAALQAVDIVGADEVLDLAGDEVAEIRIVEARAAGMAGGAAAVEIDLVELVHALDLRGAGDCPPPSRG